MLKNDYLSTKDFRGSRKYLTADGNIAEGSVICIREVQVGDVTLKNIEASVVKNQKAPLLLGQSVLERFGSFTLDNDNSNIYGYKNICSHGSHWCHNALFLSNTMEDYKATFMDYDSVQFNKYYFHITNNSTVRK